MYVSSWLSAAATASKCAMRTRSSPPTRAVSETDLGAEKVASQPARCSTDFTLRPSSVVYSWEARYFTSIVSVTGCFPSLYGLIAGECRDERRMAKPYDDQLRRKFLAAWDRGEGTVSELSVRSQPRS